MRLGKDKEVLNNFDLASSFEWLETNGLGGWASSTLPGCNTRRYHGLLVAATKPPAERMVLVSKLDETIIIDSKRFELGCNDYGKAISPDGQLFLESFSRELFPQWTYAVNGIILRKKVAMISGENSTLILYDILDAPKPFTMEFLPLIAARGYHSLQHAATNIFWDVTFEQGIFHNQPYEGAPEIYISLPGANYHHDPKWYYQFNYAIEKYRGLDFEEDLFNHGRLSIALKKGDRIGVILSTEHPGGKDVQQCFNQEVMRKQQLVDSPGDQLVTQLMLAADQFIVSRETGAGNNLQHLMTVIAGYHWFTDWGRDTMISLPGLCLCTDRPEDAKKIIAAFASCISMGMLPNRFQDNSEPPEYNNVDGTLWYFVAIYKYLDATDDKDFVLQQILPGLKNIIDWHYKGTRYNIHVEDDGLLYAGEPGQQLTWMDARIGNWVVTPRMGRPVEIQALWFNALCIFSELLALNGQLEDAEQMAEQAAKTKRTFNMRFWYEEGGHLLDNIDENNQADPTLRPNQLLAISLPFPIIEKELAAKMLVVITEKLYTPVGLRSLTPDDARYVGIYGGDQFKRDSSYHEGTVWTWLLGPYIDAVMKTKGADAIIQANKIIGDFAYHLNEGCIGSVSEILDAAGEHHPRGCIAQAWGVAEVLRVIKQYGLMLQEV